MEAPSEATNRLANYYTEVKSLERKLERNDLPEKKRKNARERLLQVTNKLIPALASQVS